LSKVERLLILAGAAATDVDECQAKSAPSSRVLRRSSSFGLPMTVFEIDADGNVVPSSVRSRPADPSRRP
jgi:hypothetical protein